MSRDASIPFRQSLRAFSGLTCGEFTSLLTSLPSELGFNDLRDASRRHQKSEKVNPNNVHSVLLKSCSKRLSGCMSLDLTDSDWMEPLKGKAIKTRVHAALKPRDVELGIDCTGLTRQRQNCAYTKPHVWCQRLRLLKLLQGVWESFRGSDEDRADHVVNAFKGLWTSKLVPRHCFIQWKSSPSEDVRYLVLASGPHALFSLLLRKIPGSNPVCYSTLAGPCRDPRLVGDISSFEVAQAAPILSNTGGMAWCHKSPFMAIQDYIADYNMENLTAELLNKLCSSLKVRGVSKFGYKRKVQAFLEHLGKDQDSINAILEEIPDDAPRKQPVNEEEARK